MAEQRGLGRRLGAIWKRVAGVGSTSLQGEVRPVVNSTAAQFYSGLEVPDLIYRPIMGSFDTAYSLLEMGQWCYEVKHSIRAIARDTFMERSGRVGSWSVVPTREMEDEGAEVDPDVLRIASELAARTNGETPLLGGAALQSCVKDFLETGDAFLELGFSREGIGRNDWAIAAAQVLPPLACFVDQGRDPDTGRITPRYWQQRGPRKSAEDCHWHPAQMLHFCHDRRRNYGTALGFPSLPYWGKIKAVAADIEQAARTVAINPWVHIAPEGWDQERLNAYEQQVRDKTSRGVISNLFLLNGMEVKRASSSVPTLAPLLETWEKYRYQMVPAAIPLYMFPGLGLDGRSGGREIDNQPALLYSRLVADIRATLGEQIRKALSIEIILRMGPDWFYSEPSRYQFDIAWPQWAVTAGEQMAIAQTETSPNQRPGDAQGDAAEP